MKTVWRCPKCGRHNGLNYLPNKRVKCRGCGAEHIITGLDRDKRPILAKK